MTTDPERLASFWAEWGFPRFTFQRVDDGRHAPVPMHLDLTPDDRVQAVARLTEPGATERATHGDSEFRWTVMRDPDGNELRDGLTNEHRGG